MSSLNPSSPEQNVTIIIIFSFPIAALFVLGVRIAGRVSSRQFGWDDGLVCTAMVLSIIETYFSYMFIKTNYVGIPLEDVPPHDPREGLMWNYAVQILYNPILALVKASILLFLLRLFGQKRGVRWYILGVHAANAAHLVANLGVVVFQCAPIARAWDFTAPGTCVDQRVFFTASAAFNILTDLLILGLPLRVFVGLKIPRRTKLALMFLFLLGFLVTIASIIRMVLLIQGLFMPLSSLDPDGNVGFATSAIETNLAIITASAPALRPLLRTWFPRLFGVAGVDRDQLEGATARRVLGGGTSMATSTTRTGKLTRAKSLSQQPKTQTRCERASRHHQHDLYPYSTHKSAAEELGSFAVDSSGDAASDGGRHGGKGRGGIEMEVEEDFPFAALPSNGIIRRSDVHILYEPNPAVCAAAAARSPSEDRQRFEGFV